MLNKCLYIQLTKKYDLKMDVEDAVDIEANCSSSIRGNFKICPEKKQGGRRKNVHYVETIFAELITSMFRLERSARLRYESSSFLIQRILYFLTS